MTLQDDHNLIEQIDKIQENAPHTTVKTLVQSRISTIPVIPQFIVAVSLLIIVFAITYIGASRSLSLQTKKMEEVLYVTTEPTTPEQGMVLNTETFTFDDLAIEAESAFVWDIQNQKVLFSKNSDTIRPLASITKLMTALVTYELTQTTAPIPITREALQSDGDSGFVDGEIFTVENLTDIVLIESSNDGATALGVEVGKTITPTDSEHAFITAMNIRAQELGLTHTTYKNTTGLDINEKEAGALGSARDVAILMDYLLTKAPDVIAHTNRDVTLITNTDGKAYRTENTNNLVSRESSIIASKTGYTTLGGGNLVVALNVGLNRPIVIVVLGSSHSGRFKDTQTLIDHTLQFLKK